MYIGDGTNRWVAIHRGDAGGVVRLALDEKAQAGSILHAATETGIPTRDSTEATGCALGACPAPPSRLTGP
ncbi:hypothetical protein [Streptomyces sp. RTd22]|uniref:hypothetical protein n=1 Tax=Streptomyces sp. RTd22 TaxID=1841249 RepID=UPI0007C5CC16|nr:hypothetical protein [Streptomyces sp. RTd22]